MLLARFARAVGLSIAALVASAAFQAATIFRHELRREFQPPPVIVLEVAPLSDTRQALVMFRAFQVPPQSEQASSMAGLCDLSAHSPLLSTLQAPRSSWCATAAAASGDFFLGTADGNLYHAHASNRSRAPAWFGRSPGRVGHIYHIECPDDGSMVVVIGEEVTAWNPTSARLLWKAEGSALWCCAFVPGQRRLIGGTHGGEIVELDPLTGRLLRSMARVTDGPVQWLAISPDGCRGAAIDCQSNCLAINLATGEPVWSRRFSRYGLRAAFSLDARTLLVVNPDAETDLGVVCATSGRLIARLNDDGKLVKGIAVFSHKTAYVWRHDGTIAEVDLTTGAFPRHFRPSADGVMQPFEAARRKLAPFVLTERGKDLP